MKEILKQLICLLYKHDKVNVRTDREHYYFNYKCKRCGCMLGLPYFKAPAPPNKYLIGCDTATKDGDHTVICEYKNNKLIKIYKK